MCTYNLENWKDFPDDSGVYVVFKSAIPIYIGSTINLRRRFASTHRRLFRLANANCVGLIPFEDINKMRLAERQAIWFFKPLLNEGKCMKPGTINSKEYNKAYYRNVCKPKRAALPKPKKRLTELLPCLLLERTFELMKNRPKELTLRQIAQNTDLTMAWLESFAQKGNTFSPTVHNVVCLYEYLSGTQLIVN